MFTRIQARGFRSLKEIDVRLGEFHALVGPNGSGKTSFLDVLGFLSDLMRERGDLFAAVQKRTTFFQSLLWKGQGDCFDLAVEAKVPEQLLSKDPSSKRFEYVRYKICITERAGQVQVQSESLVLYTNLPQEPFVEVDFEQLMDLDSWSNISPKGHISIIRDRQGVAGYRPESETERKYTIFSVDLSESAVLTPPGTKASSPVTTWFKNFLIYGVRSIDVNGLALRSPSPPESPRKFRSDGRELPSLVDSLHLGEPEYREWLEHVRSAIPDITDIVVIDRPEDRHRYLMIHYANGAIVPSWLVSDGTLRLLLLTVLAYLPDDRHYAYLIEEPENGVHPRALETILDSLRSVYDGQVLIATHSPLVVNMLEPEQILCFFKDEEGATRIVSGDKHPVIMNWGQGKPDLGVVFASGILD